MHVAQWHGDESGSDSGTVELDCVGVSARASWRRLNLVRDFEFLGRLYEEIEHDRVDVCAACDHGAAPKLYVANLLLVAARVVGRMPDVRGNAYLGINVEGAGAGTAQTDLLLHS